MSLTQIHSVKLLLLLLLFCASVQANDFRLVGTNLYDFSSAGANSRFHIRGTVSKMYPQSIEVHTFYQLYERYVFPAPGASALAMSLLGPQDVLSMKAGNMDAIGRGVAVAQIINALPHEKPSAPPITPQQYYSLDATAKNDYRAITICVTNYLLHCANLKVGNIVDGFAIPTKDKGFYDCGIPFTGDANKFEIIYRVLPNRIVEATNLSFALLGSSTNVSLNATNP